MLFVDDDDFSHVGLASLVAFERLMLTVTVVSLLVFKFTDGSLPFLSLEKIFVAQYSGSFVFDFKNIKYKIERPTLKIVTMVTRGPLQSLPQRGKMSTEPFASAPVFDDNHKRPTTTTNSTILLLLQPGAIGLNVMA